MKQHLSSETSANSNTTLDHPLIPLIDDLFYQVTKSYNSEPAEKLLAEALEKALTLPNSAEVIRNNAVKTLRQLAKGDDEQVIFLTAWKKLHTYITVNDVLWQPTDDARQDKSILYLLSEKVALGEKKAFKEVWKVFGAQIPLAYLRAKTQENSTDPKKKKHPSILWNLSWSKTTFLSLWEKWGEHITIDDLREVDKGDNTSPTILWALAEMAAMQELEPFTVVWAQLKKQFTSEDILFAAENGPSRMLTVLQLLTIANHPAIDEMLIHMPDVFVEEDLSSHLNYYRNDQTMVTVESRLQQRSDWNRKLKPLIDARNDLFDEIADVSDNIPLLNQLAQVAQQAGYVNAFYDVGVYLEKRHLMDEACEAFAQVPPASWHYLEVNEVWAINLYSQAQELDLADERRAMLEKALSFALKTSPSTRSQTIQKIAASYITAGEDAEMTSENLNPLPEEVINLFNENAPLPLCIQLLQDKVEQRALHRKIQLLECEKKYAYEARKKVERWAASESPDSFKKHVTWQFNAGKARLPAKGRQECRMIYSPFHKKSRSN